MNDTEHLTEQNLLLQKDNERLRAIVSFLGYDPNKALEEIQSEFNRTDVKRLAELLYNGDFDYVQQGTALCEQLLGTHSDYIALLGQLTVFDVPEQIDVAFLDEVFKEAIHSKYLVLWFLGTVAQWKTPEIYTLDCTSNHRQKLVEIPEVIGNLTELTSIDVANQNLTSLPASIGNLPKLEYLCAKQNQIDTLPEAIGGCSALQTLDLRQNHLRNLPDSLGQLAKLEKLYLSNNRLHALPASLGQLTALVELDLSNNLLSSLSVDLLALQRLSVFDLRYNVLTRLPEQIVQLSSLTKLMVDNNKLQDIPFGFHNLEHFEQISLQNNALSVDSTEILGLFMDGTIDHLGKFQSKTTIRGLPTALWTYFTIESLAQWPLHKRQHITRLDIRTESYWRARSSIVIPHSISRLLNLQNFYWYPDVTVLPTSIADLPKLTHINADGMRLTELHDTLKHLSQVTSIDLRNNRFCGIPTVLVAMPNLKQVKWAHNAITKRKAKSKLKVLLPSCRVI